MSAVGAEPPRRPALSRRHQLHRFLGRLHEVLDEAKVAEAEEFLAGEAHAHDTAGQRRLAQHLDEVIDPEGADARLAEQLARAEEKAARESFFSLHHDEADQVTDGESGQSSRRSGGSSGGFRSRGGSPWRSVKSRRPARVNG